MMDIVYIMDTPSTDGSWQRVCSTMVVSVYVTSVRLVSCNLTSMMLVSICETNMRLWSVMEHLPHSISCLQGEATVACR